jgi:uncharacterized membrane-anchored protein YitT (DUF2179 family)
MSFISTIVSIALSKKSEPGKGPKRPTSYKAAKEAYDFRVHLKTSIQNAVLILIGITAAGFGLKGFLLPNNFIDGGATGISLLISELTGSPLALVLVLVNLPFIVLAYKQVGLTFAIKTILAIVTLALFVAFIPYPVITNDKLLVAVFGGFFLGAGIGFAVRGGCVIDGTEVLAIYISRKLSTTIGDIIMVINVLIFLAAAYFLSIETALYAMLTYMSASKTVDFLIEGLEEYTGVTIISPKSERIRAMIIDKMGRGVTVYSGKRGFGKSGDKNYEMDIVFTVITRLEISKLYTELKIIDPNAFVVMNSIKDMKGGMVKKRALKH